MNPSKLIILPMTVAAIGSCTGAKNQKDASVSTDSRKPNIIYILADDLGYGDLSCYGQKRFQTPNIDRMTREGMRFIQHYGGRTQCGC